ncbi:MAG: toll/interleukin-1 receptor domain-containing protein [Cytophagales bacterium]
MRDTIFIGHANPEDNDFTLWLYHKLSNEGYKVACDLVNLTGGEADFWKTLQDILENQSIKYLLVFSNKTFTKQGVIDEWEQVRSIGKREKIKDFVCLLKVDDVPFDNRIGTVTMNQFRFDRSWASGLRRLTKKLYLDEVPKNKSSLTVNNWLKNRYTDFDAGLRKKKETYHSNWIEIDSIPEKMCFFRYSNSKQAEAIKKEIDSFPVIRHDNYLITFLDSLPTELFQQDLIIESKEVYSFSTKKCFQYFETEDFPGYHDARRFLVRLLKESFILYLVNLGLSSYGLSSKNQAFFYRKDQLPNDRVNYEYLGKKKRKDLVGKYFEDIWHYAVSFRPLFSPFFCFSIKGHLVFSNDGDNPWRDKSKQHAARRKKGKNFFNKEWRDMLIAFLTSLGEHEILSLPGSIDENIRVKKIPIEMNSDVGYDDPKEKGREVPIDFYDEEDEVESESYFENEYDEK